MEKTSSPVRWWDWLAITLQFLLLETFAVRLVATTWTPFLHLIQTATFLAFVVGSALGYSRFSRRVSQWLSFLYMILMLPLQWTLVIDQKTSLEEQFMSVAGRLFFSTSDFLARRPVEDPLFFVVVMTFTFWIIASWAAFTLVRSQNYLGAVIPAAIGILIIHNYDRAIAGRLWFIAFFALMALLLLGRLHFLQNQKAWRERRVFLSPDNSLELSSSMAIAAGLIILVSWTLPASIASWDSAVNTWNDITRPWREFTNEMESAVSALESPSGGRRGEFFSTELALGRGFPLSDTVMFTVDAPELLSDQKPPRYYWRGRTYDFFARGQWFTTGTERTDFSPETVNPLNASVDGKAPARFVFNTGDATFSLLYSPSEPIWVSREGLTVSVPYETGNDLVAWHALPALRSGETYQVDVLLSNPNLQQLREAGTEYPAWVTEKYLQLPDSFSPRIQQLAQDITAESETPFDKATVITNYLRSSIEYQASIPNPPRNSDILEWVLFDYKKAYCVYYATSEVLMLRSIGIPARMAVGFTEGTGGGRQNQEIRDFDDIPNRYFVQKRNAHAWPEVYFPGIGWVEFEPTGNQPTLDRPLPPRDPADLGNLDFPRDSLREEDSFTNQPEQDEEPPAAPIDDAAPLSAILYVILLVIAAAAVTFVVNRRYPLALHLPVLVRASMERTGFEVPKWIYHWEYWGHLSPTERAFESINFGLRTLDKPVPMHTTPIERAAKLTSILPQMTDPIKVLLDEHQTSLYTSRIADVMQARRAALNLRKEVIVERIRYFFVGNPQHD